MVTVLPVLRLRIAWSRRTCCEWRISFASSPSPAAWLGTAAVRRFQWLRHVRIYHCTGGSSGMTWTRSVLLPYTIGSHSCKSSNEQVDGYYRERRCPASRICICQSRERTGSKTSYRCWGMPAGIAIMQTYPLWVLYHLPTYKMEHSLYDQDKNIPANLWTPRWRSRL